MEYINLVNFEPPPNSTVAFYSHMIPLALLPYLSKRHDILRSVVSGHLLIKARGYWSHSPKSQNDGRPWLP